MSVNHDLADPHLQRAAVAEARAWAQRSIAPAGESRFERINERFGPNHMQKRCLSVSFRI